MPRKLFTKGRAYVRLYRLTAEQKQKFAQGQSAEIIITAPPRPYSARLRLCRSRLTPFATRSLKNCALHSLRSFRHIKSNYRAKCRSASLFTKLLYVQFLLRGLFTSLAVRTRCTALSQLAPFCA